MNAQIAQHLKIEETAIVKVEEWAHVLFVVVRGLGARFVSKKVVKMSNPTLVKWVVNGTECMAELITDRPHQMGCDYYKISVYKKDKKIVGQPTTWSWQFHQNVRASEFAPKISSIPGAVSA